MAESLKPGTARAPGHTYQEAILKDSSRPPEAFLDYSYEFMGDQDIPYSHYTSKDYAAREMENLWPHVWQMACREEHIAEPGDYQVGQTFANWNIVVSTRDPSEYVNAVRRMSAAASENGFSDIRFTVYSYLTGENAGKLMAVIEAPDGNRLGAMLDALERDWAATVLDDMVRIRRYDHGSTMNCEVVQISES